MLNFKQQISKFKSEFQLEPALNLIILLMMVSILFIASLALYRPISIQQYHFVQQLALQEAYPKTQAMALELSKQEFIRSMDYYRLIYAKHYESSHIRTYPAASYETQ